MTESRSRPPGMRDLVGKTDLLWITLDTLRFDVAVRAMQTGQTPFLQQLIPDGWQRRHSPGSFTYAAHQAFFAGFLPTPVTPGPHPRLFAASFPGSETTSDTTFVFDAPDVVSGLRAVGYHSVCIGGVGFFNKQSPLGSVFPDLFDESHWSTSMGVTARNSTETQVTTAVRAVQPLSPDQRLFLFLNISALHQPNCIYIDGATTDSPDTQAAALAYVDSQLSRLFVTLRRRADVFCVICADHGTAYGEDGYVGHRLAHPVVWDVPYADFLLPQQP